VNSWDISLKKQLRNKNRFICGLNNVGRIFKNRGFWPYFFVFTFAAGDSPDGTQSSKSNQHALTEVRETPFRHGQALLCIFKSGHHTHSSKLLRILDENYYEKDMFFQNPSSNMLLPFPSQSPDFLTPKSARRLSIGN
jgi:hypothetical protein